MTTVEQDRDAFDARRVLGLDGLLRAYNETGVLAAADVHAARTLARLCGEESDEVLLAAALAVRAPRLGHVCTDLATVRHTVAVDNDADVDVRTLPWPEDAGWLPAVAASPLTAAGTDQGARRPLRLVGTLLYLDRYWRSEQQVAADLSTRSAMPSDDVDVALLAQGLTRLFPEQSSERQRLAAATAVLRRLAVVAGGPGTGKTTTVARILALLDEQAAARGTSPPVVALAAPTGKAATRLEEAVQSEARDLLVAAEVRERLLGLSASTLHRLLGWRPGYRNRFRHERGNRLPHDVVVVDETSMVSLSLMGSLVAAVRADARLVLVGDHEQLASVEAGAVLGDVVGPVGDKLYLRPRARRALAATAGVEPPAADPPPGVTVGDGIVVLRHVYRYSGGIARLAEAVQAGDPDAAVAVLRSGTEDVDWIETDVGADGSAAALDVLRTRIVDSAARVFAAANAGDAVGALRALGKMRLLCAHRRGPYGASRWMAQVQGWLASHLDGFAARGQWYPGQPLMVTANDYGLHLYNGDTGVIIAKDDDRIAAVFERRGEPLEVSPSLLSAVETVYAMTIHKSQGSQFDDVAVVLPPVDSPILTRELLYTAVTRARQGVLLIGTEDSVRAAVSRPIARASGLRAALWGARE